MVSRAVVFVIRWRMRSTCICSAIFILLIGQGCADSDAHHTTQFVPIAGVSGCQVFSPADFGGSVSTAYNAATKDLKATDAASICISAGGTIDAAIVITGPKSLILGPGTYEQSASVTLAGDGPSFVGESYGSTILLAKEGFLAPQINIADVANRYRIQNMEIRRGDVAPSAETAIGIATGPVNNFGTISDLHITKQFRGMSLGVTGITYIEHVTIMDSKADGILLSNGAGKAACQYYMRSILLQGNGGAGILAVPDGATMSVGNWDEILTFINGGPAIRAATVGNNVVAALRVTNSFFGNDGQVAGTPAGIQIDGGGNHVFSNTYIELMGAHYLGTSFLPVSGMVIQAGTTNVQLSNMTFNQNSANAIVNYGTNVNINGSTISNNGYGMAVGQQGGIVLGAAASMHVSATQFINATNTQAVGIASQTNNFSVVGSSFEVGTGVSVTAPNKAAVVQSGNTGF